MFPCNVRTGTPIVKWKTSKLEEEPYTPLGNVAFPVTEEAGSAEEQQLRSFQDLLLRTFEPQPDLAMPISTPYPPPVCLPSAATLTIVEQPMKETRYRYKSESGSHGPLIGESSTPQRKTYPSVRPAWTGVCLEPVGRHFGDELKERVTKVKRGDPRAQLQNHDPGLPHRIRASLWLADREEPHVHRLTMKGRDEEDCCYVTVREDGRATLARKGSQVDRVAEEARRLLGEAKKEAAELNLNLVRIQFSAECCQDGVWRTLCCVYSNPVANSKAGKLKITKVNRTSGSCSGGDEVWILCEKINKKDIQIKFFEEDEETRVRTWEALASFAESDVHYQVSALGPTAWAFGA
ncbi:nuclear factor nf-kappa-B P105 subunit, putative [Ixodes scapularis]|uniref:Nuclear factor nf-kappa-B P105 subunit, putative n=1 Tax=Ixodes scapularis TaxID=6945 RepID=B7PL56_IXOSC|nr:nuclear factor nf-kappa-B P105 subunit, putative [Ixodes scapularis]|eukprot:XP_002434504.1 nuclear factor nf-kappa-B P105 subunit, putative [Ixodes scapularis]